MKRMSFSETIFLFFLALIIFGPKKLPEIARYVGKTLAEFRRASNEFKAQIEQEIAHMEVENRKSTTLPPSPAPEGTASRTVDLTSTNPEPSSGNSLPQNPAATNTQQGEGDASATLAAATEVPPTPSAPDVPATEAAAGNVAAEPVAADGNASPAEPVPAAKPVTSPTSQESHV